MKEAVAGADLVQENGPERQGLQDQIICRHGCRGAKGFHHRFEFIRSDDERDAIGLQVSRAMCDWPPI